MVREVEGFYVDDFHCEQNMLHYWYDRIESLEVNTPDTVLFELYDGEPDYEEILSTMEAKGWDQGFIRSDNFSDKVNPLNGSKIYRRELSEIKRTFETLKNHHLNHMDAPLGELVAVREWLDLQYCPVSYCNVWHPNEIRCFIEDNELRYTTPCISPIQETNLAYDCTFEYLKERLSDGIDLPTNQIREVMKEFTEYAWHADWCLTTDLEWYFIDMGLDGVYWSEDQGQWVTMCGHNEIEEEIMTTRANEALSIPET